MKRLVASFRDFLDLPKAKRVLHPLFEQHVEAVWEHMRPKVELDAEAILSARPDSNLMNRTELLAAARQRLEYFIRTSKRKGRELLNLRERLRQHMRSKAYSLSSMWGRKRWENDPRGPIPEHVHAFFRLPIEDRSFDHPAVKFLMARHGGKVEPHLERFSARYPVLKEGPWEVHVVKGLERLKHVILKSKKADEVRPRLNRTLEAYAQSLQREANLQK